MRRASEKLPGDPAGEETLPGAEQAIAKPFLKWIGGKQNLVRDLVPIMPPREEIVRYREPFLGAGSLFFSFRPKVSFLSDINSDLIACYEQIREHPQEIASLLEIHAGENCEKYYYQQRAFYNSNASSSIERAARFVYLNRTCYNGVFRVNRQGRFNVPYGRKDNPALPSAPVLRAVSRALTGASLRAIDYRAALAEAGPGDFVYIDPPYPALNGTSYFTHYTVDRFSERDQKDLASAVRELAASGANFMVSNADTPLIRELYSGFVFTQLAAVRYVSCSKARHKVSELVITSYCPGRST